MSQEIWATQNGLTYSAELTRRALYCWAARTGANTPGIISGGLISPADLQLSAPVSGLSVNISTGECLVGGTSGGAQGGYYCRNTGTANLAIGANSSGNPRIDTICFTAGDSAYTEPSDVPGGANAGVPAVVPGTPTVGATLSNLSGVAAVPASSLVLGYVLVPNGAANIVTANILNAAGVVTGLPVLRHVAATTNTTAASGQWVGCGPGITVTLPAPTESSMLAITAGINVTSASPVTVAASSGAINGLGLSSAASLLLGIPGASVILEGTGTNWYVIAGQQDTGWLALTLGTNIGAVGSRTPSARLAGNWVYVKGGVQPTASIAAGAVIATLPSSMWPNDTLPFSIPHVGAGPTYNVVFGGIGTTGQITLAGNALTSSDIIYFSGITPYTLT